MRARSRVARGNQTPAQTEIDDQPREGIGQRVRGRRVHQQAVGLVRNQTRNSGDTRRHDGRSAGHRLEQHARHAFARQRRQHEQVVFAIQREQTLERHGPDDAKPFFHAECPRSTLDLLLLGDARRTDRRSDDVERDIEAAVDEPADDVGQHAKSLARIDAGDGEDSLPRRRARIVSRRDIAGADRRRSRFDDDMSLARVLARERRAVREGQRPIGHPLHVALFERGVPIPQPLLRAAIRHRRLRGRQIADDEDEGGAAEKAGAGEREDGSGRRDPAVQQVDPFRETQQPRQHQRQARVELQRSVEVRQRDQRDVRSAHRRPFAARRAQQRNRQHDLVEVRRERVDVARERALDFAQRPVRRAPERHVINNS